MQGTTWPFTDPITLYRDITSYNVIRGWCPATFEYIKAPSMTAQFPLLPRVIAPRVSQPNIVDFVEDVSSDLASHTASGISSVSSFNWNLTSVTWSLCHPISFSSLSQLQRHGNSENSTSSSPRIHRGEKSTVSSHHAWTWYRPILGISTRHDYHHYPSHPETRIIAEDTSAGQCSSHRKIIDQDLIHGTY